MVASSFSLTTPNNASGPCGNCSGRGGGPRDRGVPARPGLLLVCAADAFHVTQAIIPPVPSSRRVAHWGH